MKKMLIYPARGESSIFQASAPMKAGSMKGTRNSSFIVFLNGRSVRVTSQAKKVPTMVPVMVTPTERISELPSAL